MEENSESLQNQTTHIDSNEKKKINWNKVLIGLGVFGLVLAIGGVSFFFGRRNQKSQSPDLTPTPTQSVSPSPTLTPIPSPNSQSPTTTLTPTKKPTPTPTPTPIPTPVIKTMTLSATASLDGFRSSNGGGNDGLDIRAGRNVNLVTRGFVSFDLSGIPASATITEATLRLYQTKTIGNPYGVGGNLKVDHLDYGTSLDDPDYGASSLISNYATLTTNASVEWKDVISTDQVKGDRSASRTRSQFRIHFTTEVTGGDVTGDFAYYESANNSEGTGNTPQLVIKYY